MSRRIVEPPQQVFKSVEDLIEKVGVEGLVVGMHGAVADLRRVGPTPRCHRTGAARERMMRRQEQQGGQPVYARGARALVLALAALVSCGTGDDALRGSSDPTELPSPGDEGAPTGPAALLACLEAEGIDTSEPQPFDPAVAEPAWQRCRDVERQRGLLAGQSADRVDRFLAFDDCMARRGAIPPIPSYHAVDEDTALGCRPAAEGVAVFACLREQGLDVPDPTSGDPVSEQPYPPAAAVAAWAACKQVYVTGAGLLPREVPNGLPRLDCMAERGWLTVTFTRLPDDPAWDEARAACPGGFGP
jgi:hypothetical protein